MTWGAVAVGAVGVVSAGAGAYSANKAAGAQADAEERANRTQQAQFDQTRQDQMPWLQRGNAAGDRLSYMLGTGGTQGSSGGLITANDLVDTSGGDWKPNATLYANSPEYKAAWDSFYATHQEKYGVAPNFTRGSGLAAGEDQIQAAGFDLNAYNQAHQQQQPTSNDPAYGSLLRNFSQSDLDGDSVYQSGLQFGLDQGIKGLNRQASATGSLLSGATLKALTKYGNDYGSTKANESFNRFNTNKQQTYNMLAGVAGTGQTAVNNVGAAGQNMSNNVSQNQLGMGNARAASSIGMGNALSSGVSGAYNMNQNNQLMNKMFPSGGSGVSGGGYNPYADPSGTYGMDRGLGSYDAVGNGGWGIE